MIAAFTRFDLSSSLARSQTLLALGLVAVSGILVPVPGMAVLAAALVTSVMVSAPFLADERGRLDILYGVLPVSRRTVVIGRLLSLVVYYVAAAVLATVLTVCVALVRGQPVPLELLLTVHAASLGFVGISFALQLPVFFRVGFSRGRMMAYAPSFAVVGVLWLLQAAGVPVQEHLAGMSSAAIVITGVLIAIVGIACALVIAIRVYSSRELK
jgi:hypothetical protein